MSLFMLVRRTVVSSIKCHHALRSLHAAPAAPAAEIVVDKLEEDRHGIAVISFNRPSARNSLGRNLVDLMTKNLDQLKTDDNVRVLIIRSLVSGIFCSGADLKERLAMSQNDVSLFLNKLRFVAKQIYEFPKPTIAALDGIALGGGLEYALAADIRVASSSAKMGLVETKLAIIPGAGGTQRLSRLIGPSMAKELIFTGRVFDGMEAEKMGIVNHSVEQNDGGNAAYLKAVQIAEEIIPNGPIAVQLAKRAIDRGIEVDIESGLEFERSYYAQIIPTKDRIEGLTAFKEKRRPKFRGE